MMLLFVGSIDKIIEQVRETTKNLHYIMTYLCIISK